MKSGYVEKFDNDYFPDQ